MVELLEILEQATPRDLTELRHCRTIADVMLNKFYWHTIEEVDWPTNQESGIAAALALLAHSHRGNSGQGFIERWAKNAPKKTQSVHINEHRFVTFLRSDDWDAFFTNALVGVRLLNKYDQCVDATALVSCCRWRAEESEWGTTGRDKFRLEIAELFYRHQSDHV